MIYQQPKTLKTLCIIQPHHETVSNIIYVTIWQSNNNSLQYYSRVKHISTYHVPHILAIYVIMSHSGRNF